MSCLCAESYQMPQIPGVGRHSELSAEVGIQNCRCLPCPSQGQPFPLRPHGPPQQQELSFCCWVPGKGLQPLQLQRLGKGREEEGAVYQNDSPYLFSLIQGW